MRRFASVVALLAVGSFLLVVALVLLLDVAGAGTLVIRRLTSRSLGSLAPGYAASPTGFKIYAALLGAIGLVFVGLAEAYALPTAGVIAMAGGVVAFVVLSIIVIVGEVRTYRALKR